MSPVRRIDRDHTPETPEPVRRFLLEGKYDYNDDSDDFNVYKLAGARLRGRFEEIADLWESHRAVLLPEWIATRPGTRPAAWWWLEAPEPRALVVAPEMAWGGCAMADAQWRRCLGVPPLRAQWRRPEHPDVFVESQASYLRRHALLTPAEAHALHDGAYEPQYVPYDANDSLSHKRPEIP